MTTHFLKNLNKYYIKNRKMDKQTKQFLSIIPGATCGVDCRHADLQYGMRTFKKMMSTSKKIETLYERKEFIKKSDKKRKIRDVAKYKEKRRNGNA